MARKLSPTASNSAPVELLAPNQLLQETEQRLDRVSGVQQCPGLLDGLAHPLDHDRRDQILLGREVAKQGPATHAGALRDLADADLEPALAEQRLGCVQQPPAVALGIGA